MRSPDLGPGIGMEVPEDVQRAFKEPGIRIVRGRVHVASVVLRDNPDGAEKPVTGYVLLGPDTEAPRTHVVTGRTHVGVLTTIFSHEELKPESQVKQPRSGIIPTAGIDFRKLAGK